MITVRPGKNAGKGHLSGSWDHDCESDDLRTIWLKYQHESNSFQLSQEDDRFRRQMIVLEQGTVLGFQCNRMSDKQIERFHEQMYLIRTFEETLLELFEEGELSGTTHTYIGQEANAVGVIDHLQDQDVIFSNHRCHGHYLARTRNVKGLLAEIMGKQEGICSGVGGSQHLADQNFYTNGVQGGIVPQAAGIALAEKKQSRDSVTVVFIGDGTLGEGAVYESMNISKLWNLPLLYVIENNYYSQSTPSSLQIAGDIVDRPEAFDIDVTGLTSNNVKRIHEEAEQVVNQVRHEETPRALLLNTYRLAPHSKGEDHRNQEEIEQWKKKDPLKYTRKSLSSECRNDIESRCEDLVKEAITWCKKRN